MVALDSQVGDLEGVEDVHCEVVGQVRKDAGHADKPDLALVPQLLERLDRMVLLQRGPARGHVHLDEIQVIRTEPPQRLSTTARTLPGL